MKKIGGYTRSAVYHLRRNKTYALFCVVGVAIMTVFVSLLFQLLNNVLLNTKPFVHADRTVHLGAYVDARGEAVMGIPPEDVALFLANLNACELCAFHDVQYGNIFAGEMMHSGMVAFVNGDYWRLHAFDFVEGRPFTGEEVERHLPVAVLTRDYARQLYSSGQLLGNRLTFQDTEYRVIGVVEDYANAGGHNDRLWVPSSFNRFTPDESRYFDLYLLPRERVSLGEFKRKVAYEVRSYFRNRSMDVPLRGEEVRTLKEEHVAYLGVNTLKYGVPAALLFLLLIPALNIVLLNDAHWRNKAEETGIRRAVGATMGASFVQVLVENLLLVAAGTLAGVVLTLPTLHVVNDLLMQSEVHGSISFQPVLDWRVIGLGVLPVALVFTLLSGGIPAYRLARQPIVKTLKGDEAC